jgi:hypothetical protein
VFYLMAESDRAGAPPVPPPYDEVAAPGGEGDDGEGDGKEDDGAKDAEPKPESKSDDAGGESRLYLGPTGVGVAGTF